MLNGRPQPGVRKAFTLIELILYISILSIVLGALVIFLWNIIGLGVKNSTQAEVSSQTRYVMEKIKYEIRNAVSINTGTSNFGVNLASNSSNQLSLQGTAPDDPVVINVLNGTAQMKKGASAAVSLNSNNTRVTDLTFNNYSSGDGKTKNIGFTLSISANFNGSNRAEYTESENLRTSVELRSN